IRPHHATLPRQDMVFLAHALFCPFDREAMIACEGFHPVLVVSGALAQDLPADHGNAHDLMEEVHHPLGARQPAEVAVYDDAVEAVVEEGQPPNNWVNSSMANPARPGRVRKAV